MKKENLALYVLTLPYHKPRQSRNLGTYEKNILRGNERNYSMRNNTNREKLRNTEKFV